MVEIEGKVSNTSISILIATNTFLSYASPNIVETCKLDKVKPEKPWMVQLSIGTKRKVSEIVRDYEVKLNNSPPKIVLNILPLGSYAILNGMDWLEQHHVVLDCLHKSILCIYSQGNPVKIQRIPKNIFVRQISALQEKKCFRKGYKLFAVNIQNIEVER